MGLQSTSTSTSSTTSTSTTTMKAALFLLSALVASAFAAPKNELTCSICIDVITDLDNFITSDTTEQQIVDFAKELCHALEEQCNAMMEANIPAIIDGLVNDNLNPTEVCTMITMCPRTFASTPPSLHSSTLSTVDQ